MLANCIHNNDNKSNNNNRNDATATLATTTTTMIIIMIITIAMVTLECLASATLRNNCLLVVGKSAFDCCKAFGECV